MPDEGKIWNRPVTLCECPGVQGQYDSTLLVTSEGVVYASWMNWQATRFSKSADHGETWTKPIKVSGGHWTDHPWLGTSAGGKDVYIAWSQGDPVEAHSHDYGRTWSAPQKIANIKHRFYFPTGFVVSPSGTAVIIASGFHCGMGTQNCKNDVRIDVFRSTNGGKKWSDVRADRLYTGPSWQTASETTIGMDSVGNMVLEYSGATVAGASDRGFARIFPPHRASCQCWIRV